MDNFTYKDEYDDNVASVVEPKEENLQGEDNMYANIPKPPSAKKPVTAAPSMPAQLNRYLEKTAQHPTSEARTNSFAGNSYLQNQVGKFVKICMQAGSKTLEHYGHLKAADNNYIVLAAANAEMLCEINSVKFIQII